MKEIRLDRYLSEMGQGSRSQVKEMARKGRILVNGVAVRKADTKVCPERDEVMVDGRPVHYVGLEYIMLNKPAGVVSATRDHVYPTVMDLIDSQRGDLFPVGRLDLDTEGLLLLTNDGELSHRLLSPRRHVDKVYYALVKDSMEEGWGQRFLDGMEWEDGALLKPALAWTVSFRADGRCRVETGAAAPIPGLAERLAGLSLPHPAMGESGVALAIQEGKYHQVKRMFEAVGGRVVFLKRLAMGPLWLDDGLKPGESRPLTDGEIALLRES